MVDMITSVIVTYCTGFRFVNICDSGATNDKQGSLEQCVYHTFYLLFCTCTSQLETMVYQK